MALASYAELIDGIRDWLGRANDTTNLPSTRVADLVAMAEAEIYDRLRVREMEFVSEFTTNQFVFTLPADFVEIRRFFMAGSPRFSLEYMAPPQFYVTTAPNVVGRPRFFTVESSSLIVGPPPDQSYDFKLAYYRRLPALSGATNTIFTARPHLYLYGALAHAAPFVDDDERLVTWRGQFEAALQQAQQASDRGAYSGSPLIMRAG